MLVIVEDRNIQGFDEGVFDLETGRGGDVFEIDAAKRRGDTGDRVDHGLDRVGIDLDIKDIDVGKLLEQYRLAFHHRLAGQRAGIAQPQHGGAVGDHGHEIALGGIAIGVFGIVPDRLDRFGYAGRVGQRQLAVGRKRFGDRNTELSGLRALVIIQCFLLARVFGHIVRAVVVLRMMPRCRTSSCNDARV